MIYIPATRIISSPDVTYWSVAYHTLGQGSASGDTVSEKSDYSEEKYKLIFKFG